MVEHFPTEMDAGSAKKMRPGTDWVAKGHQETVHRTHLKPRHPRAKFCTANGGNTPTSGLEQPAECSP
jgi:hypothetical protein